MPPSLFRSVARLPAGKLVFELFLVFVTVLAALFANAAWQDRRDRAAGRGALLAFAAEMRTNKDEIDARLDHHRVIVANTKAFLRELDGGAAPPPEIFALRDRLTAGKGLRTPLLSRAAWDTSLIAGACTQIPLATMLRIGRVYEVQRRLEAVLDQLIASFASPTFFDTQRATATATAFMVTFSMIVELELTQTAAYEHCLAELGSS